MASKRINPSKSPFGKFDPKTILSLPCIERQSNKDAIIVEVFILTKGRHRIDRYTVGNVKTTNLESEQWKICTYGGIDRFYIFLVILDSQTIKISSKIRKMLSVTLKTTLNLVKSHLTSKRYEIHCDIRVQVRSMFTVC